ncbi:MAG: bifunctional riboflavin kinase/FAD synthetase [Xanthobacteraceae bacterium]|nr:bifunctional riboflavin kinase/FAD synthetase [Xanthobacteraceae bacterium]PWB59384.1 MAG: bifunctional riboflavin kinase/FAD synthetase [Bradyrhizobiaceae bacterium]
MIERSKPFVVVRDDAPAIAALKGAVVAIGNFDGVHRGHRSVIDAAVARARALGRPAAALTFEPHPRSVLRPHEPVFRLTDERDKLRLLAGTELDGAFVLTFDRAFAATSAEAFIERILIERIAVSGASIGFDFHFGMARRGSPAFLAAEGERRGFSVAIMPPLEDEGRPVSASSIRAALAEGRVVEAAELLGYPWFVSGSVIGGEKRGRTLGYPTANLRLDPACNLKHGIYAVRVDARGAIREGVASFGRRPTFDNGAPLLEVHLFDFAGDLYGAPLDVAFVGWIRPELKFDSVSELVARMDEDSRLARAALARAGDAFPPFGPLA